MPPQVLDLGVYEDLKSSVGDDFIAELVTTFLEEAPPMLAELRRAHLAQDAESLRRTAHSLKANANTFGAVLLGQHAKALEHGGIPGDDVSLSQLENLYRETAAALRVLIDG